MSSEGEYQSYCDPQEIEEQAIAQECPDCGIAHNDGSACHEYDQEDDVSTTEKVKHTSGPWFTDIRATYGSDHHVVTVECSDGMGRVRLADCGPVGAIDSICDLENGANARLIAASPEMLSALEALTGTIRDLLNVYDDNSARWLVTKGAFKSAEAAIRRAKGE